MLPRNDDGSSALVQLPFTVNFFGTLRSSLYVNNNGNVTFDAPLSAYTPTPLVGTGRVMIAPFWADVDTRPAASDVVTYGNVTVDGRSAFCVNWAGVAGVGYYNQQADKLNKFQLLLIHRPDIGASEFDIEMNFDQIQWETGDASGGTGGVGGSSARMGYTNGDVTKSYEEEGSGVNGAFLDSNPTGLIHRSRNSSQLGRYVFPVRAGRTLQGASPTDKRFATSYYVSPASVVNQAQWTARGRALGQAVKSGSARRHVTVVLDFGAQGYRPGTGWIFQPVASTDLVRLIEAERIARRFAAGFVDSIGQSFPLYRPHLLLVLGVSNDGDRLLEEKCPTDNTKKGYFCAGQEWAQLVKRVDDWLTSSAQPRPFGRFVTVRGGNDIEAGFCPDKFRAQGVRVCPEAALSWNNGYRITNSGRARYYLNFGSCDGCPCPIPSRCSASTLTSPDFLAGVGGYTASDYYSLSTNGAYVLPQIFATDTYQAEQWAVMANFWNTRGGDKVVFWGSLTQDQACRYNFVRGRGDTCGILSLSPLQRTASSTANLPHEGYSQLRESLRTRGLTGILIHQLADITWIE